MRFPRNARIFRGQLDTAPFAAVFFVLVLLLFISSRPAFTPGVHIDLPAGDAGASGTLDPLVVVGIDTEGQLYFENRLRTEDELLQRLEALIQQSPQPVTLMVQADRAGRLEATTRWLSRVSRLGFRKVVLSTKKESHPADAVEPNAEVR
jgi:biopolymer transport protein ExbD